MIRPQCIIRTELKCWCLGMTKAIDSHGIRRTNRAVSQAKPKVSIRISLELAEFVASIIDDHQALAQSSIIQLFNLKTEMRTKHLGMSETGLLNLVPCHQQVDILGNGILLRLHDILLPCSRGVIRTVTVTFLLVVFYNNTAIKLAFLSRSFGRPRGKFKSTKVFVI